VQIHGHVAEHERLAEELGLQHHEPVAPGPDATESRVTQ
jgi:hypothetical protein